MNGQMMSIKASHTHTCRPTDTQILAGV